MRMRTKGETGAGGETEVRGETERGEVREVRGETEGGEVREVRRAVEVEATPEEVWEALVTEEGRERWLGEPDREVHIEFADPPNRLRWWWGGEEQPATRVEFQIVELAPCVTRVVVRESMPSLLSPAVPLASLVSSFALVVA